MKKMVKVMAIVAVLVMMVACFAGCGSKKSAVEKIQKAGKLTVLTEPGFAPFEYIDAEGNIVNVELLASIPTDANGYIELVAAWK